MSHKNKGSTKNNQAIKPTNAAVAIHKALGVPEKHFEAPEQKWEDIENIFQASANAIVTTGRDINSALALPGVALNIENKEELTIAINGLTRDLETFAGELADIHAKHAGRTGPIREQHDIINSLSIFDEYVAFNTKFQSVILPTVLVVMDGIGRACQKISDEMPLPAEDAAQENMNAVETETAELTESDKV